MNDKLMSMLGLCRRAGKLTLGNDAVIDSINLRKSKLVLLADDCSENTAKAVLRKAHQSNVHAYVIAYTKDDISYAVGKFTAVLSINDNGFAKSVEKLICSLKED
ncbi:MAG: ribosomal L7Ae/L30e/S12e/Gadd45 family protein [Ruminococcus sp.]|nr:ribosomal L7Ae/L30e/S12e/Gadd45 family protein [Ruminococcus sp.]